MRLEQICNNVGIKKDNKYYCRARSITALDCKYLGDLSGPRNNPYRYCEKPGDTALRSFCRYFKHFFLQVYYSVVK